MAAHKHNAIILQNFTKKDLLTAFVKEMNTLSEDPIVIPESINHQYSTTCDGNSAIYHSILIHYKTIT